MTNKNIFKKSLVFLSFAFVMVLGFFAFAYVDPIDPAPATATLIGNTIQVVPTTTRSLSEDCDSEGAPKAYYSGASLYMKIQSLAQTSNKRIVASTRILKYDPYESFSNLTFPRISNIIPHKTSVPVSNKNILVVNIDPASKVKKPNSSYQRGKLAGQLVYNGHYQGISTASSSNSIGYTYQVASETSPRTINVNSNIFIPAIDQSYVCWDYYVAYCGDGKIDNADGGNGDGHEGILNDAGDIIPRSEVGLLSVTPNEVCDDGAQNGQPGKCKTDCTGIGGGTPPTGGATCTLTASSATITSGQTVTLTASFTSGATASFSPELSVTPAFTYPTWNGTATATPTTTTTYVLNVGGANGLSGTSCSTTVNVAQPIPHLSCLLTINPGYVTTGTIVSVGWKIANGNFFGTDINVSPSMYGWPTTIPANLYNGVRQAVPLTTGDFNFSLFVYNNLEEYTCTGVLHVVENIPAGCSLTTSTPMIMPGQTGYLSASYGNAVLATLTPAITGLNFLYPVRNNTAIAVHPTQTTTYTLNTLNPFGTGSTCTATIGVMNTGVVLDKQLVTNIPYRSGDQVSFKISFANQGPSVVNNVIVSDYLPAGLDYVTSQIFGVAPFTFATGTNGANQFVEYSGFSLTPGQQGYIIVVGRYKGYEYANQTLNNAFLKASNSPDKYSSALFYSYRPSGNATAVKTSDKPSYVPGEDARFTIAVTNNGPDAISNVRITDDRPNTDCITPDSQWTTNMPNPPFSMTTPTDPYVWTYNSSLAVGQTIYLYITGHVSNSASCVGSYINNANIAYDVNAVTQTGVAPGANFQISTTPSSTVVFEKKLVQYGNNSGDPVVFELLYHNNGTATISNFDIVDYWPGTLNFVSSSPLPTTQIPTEGGRELHWIVNSPLAPNAVGKITINGTIR